MAREGQRRVEVWVDEAEYQRVMADKPKGWLAAEIRRLFEANQPRTMPIKVASGGNPANRAHKVGCKCAMCA